MTTWATARGGTQSGACRDRQARALATGCARTAGRLVQGALLLRPPVQSLAADASRVRVKLEPMAPEPGLEALRRRAEELGLSPGEVRLHRLPPHALWGLASYGLFGRYRHWSRGKAYQRLRLQGELGLQRIYELIVHTEPPQAYVLSGNRPIEDLLVTAHVLGHADFFHRSVWLRERDAGVGRRVLLHRQRIADYACEHGQAAVEAVLDAALLIEAHVARYGPQDVLGALARLAPLEPWQRDCLGMVREEALYFQAQERTKIVNEGWASFWHLRILRAEELAPSDRVDIALLHSRLVAMAPGRLNPYALGLEILEQLAEEAGAAPGEAPRGKALEALLDLATVADDRSLVRDWFSQRSVDRLKLVVPMPGDNVSSHVEDVRRELLRQIGGAARPSVEVEQAVAGCTLRLRHLHDGRDLDLPDAEAVLGEVQRLWGAPVQLETMVGGQRVCLRHDGQEMRRDG